MILASFVIVALSYLLGSIPTGYLLVKLFRHEDIRSVGSGNIGATNVLRSGGKGLGAATFLLDVLKGAPLSGWARCWLPSFCPPCHSAMHRPWLRFPRFSDTCSPSGSASAVAKASPPDLASFWLPRPWRLFPQSRLFTVILLVTRYVSLASILGAASFPLFAWFLVQRR